jgi:hypothetical protein
VTAPWTDVEAVLHLAYVVRRQATALAQVPPQAPAMRRWVPTLRRVRLLEVEAQARRQTREERRAMLAARVRIERERREGARRR